MTNHRMKDRRETFRSEVFVGASGFCVTFQNSGLRSIGLVAGESGFPSTAVAGLICWFR